MDSVAAATAAATTTAAPKLIFLVPYRDRAQQREFFLRQMKYVMEDFPNDYYRIYFVHQRYGGSFNRGGMKNAGAQAIQQLFPADWENITLVFNDVDCMPYTKNFLPYETTYGVVKHFYGFPNTLGGIVSITGRTFVECGGFPMFYGYGWEDNLLKVRVDQAGFYIDRSVFFPLYDPNILSFRDGNYKDLNRAEFSEYIQGRVHEGIHSIQRMEFEIDEDNHFIDVFLLDFGRPENELAKIPYDLRKGNAPFGDPLALAKRNRGGASARRGSNMTMIGAATPRSSSTETFSFHHPPPPTGKPSYVPNLRVASSHRNPVFKSPFWAHR